MSDTAQRSQPPARWVSLPSGEDTGVTAGGNAGGQHKLIELAVGRQRAQGRWREFLGKHLKRFRESRVLCDLPEHNRDIEHVYHKLGIEDACIHGFTKPNPVYDRIKARYPHIHLYDALAIDLGSYTDEPFGIVSLDIDDELGGDDMLPLQLMLLGNGFTDKFAVAITCVDFSKTSENPFGVNYDSPFYYIYDTICYQLAYSRLGMIERFQGCTYDEGYLSHALLEKREREFTKAKSESARQDLVKHRSVFYGLRACYEELIEIYTKALMNRNVVIAAVSSLLGVEKPEYRDEATWKSFARRRSGIVLWATLLKHGYGYGPVAVERYKYVDEQNRGMIADYMCFERVSKETRSKIPDWLVVEDGRMRIDSRLASYNGLDMTMYFDAVGLWLGKLGTFDVMSLPDPTDLGGGVVAIDPNNMKDKAMALLARGRSDEEILAKCPIPVELLRAYRDEFAAQEQRRRERQRREEEVWRHKELQETLERERLALAERERQAREEAAKVALAPTPEELELAELEKQIAVEEQARDEAEQAEHEELSRKAREEVLAWQRMTPEERASAQQAALAAAGAVMDLPERGKDVVAILAASEPEAEEPAKADSSPAAALSSPEIVVLSESVKVEEPVMTKRTEEPWIQRHIKLLREILEILAFADGALSRSSLAPSAAKQDSWWLSSVLRLFCARKYLHHDVRHKTYSRIGGKPPKLTEAELREIAVMSANYVRLTPLDKLARGPLPSSEVRFHKSDVPAPRQQSLFPEATGEFEITPDGGPETSEAPSGFNKIGFASNAPWFNLVEGNQLRGTLINVFERTDLRMESGTSKFFQVELLEPALVRKGKGEKAVVVEAAAGTIVNLNCNAKTQEFEALIPEIVRGAEYQVFVHVGKRFPISRGRTMWDITAAVKLVKPALGTKIASKSDAEPENVAPEAASEIDAEPESPTEVAGAEVEHNDELADAPAHGSLPGREPDVALPELIAGLREILMVQRQRLPAMIEALNGQHDAIVELRDALTNLRSEQAELGRKIDRLYAEWFKDSQVTS
jgi:hypothetical protein